MNIALKLENSPRFPFQKSTEKHLLLLLLLLLLLITLKVSR
jgi:hypothetical protein